jgi:hypothetical protein
MRASAAAGRRAGRAPAAPQRAHARPPPRGVIGHRDRAVSAFDEHRLVKAGAARRPRRPAAALRAAPRRRTRALATPRHEPAAVVGGGRPPGRPPPFVEDGEWSRRIKASPLATNGQQLGSVAVRSVQAARARSSSREPLDASGRPAPTATPQADADRGTAASASARSGEKQQGAVVHAGRTGSSRPRRKSADADREPLGSFAREECPGTSEIRCRAEATRRGRGDHRKARARAERNRHGDGHGERASPSSP